LKEKIDGTIKVQGCADRRVQQEYTTKAETSSANSITRALMISSAIDTKEG